VLGHPLIVGETFMALSQDDLYMRWRPKTKPDFMTIAHPFPGTPEPDLTPVAMFGGYPLAQTPFGAFIGDDQVSPFVAILSQTGKPIWHRDVMNRLGVPAVKDSLVFANAGGDRALASIVALNSANGRTAWEFAPNGFPSEPVTLITRTKSRQPTPQEQATLKAMQSAMAKRGRSSPDVSSPVNLEESTPCIDAQHGHWLNPGLVVVGDRVYGEVGRSIVSLSQSTGEPGWNFALESGEVAHSIAASHDHLFVSLERRLIALNLQTGKLEWSTPTPSAGTLTIANGLVILAIGTPGSNADGGRILVFGNDQKAEAKESPSLPPPPK
jgi:outer membrane protein assembly factor BamB